MSFVFLLKISIYIFKKIFITFLTVPCISSLFLVFLSHFIIFSVQFQLGKTYFYYRSRRNKLGKLVFDLQWVTFLAHIYLHSALVSSHRSYEENLSIFKAKAKHMAQEGKCNFPQWFMIGTDNNLLTPLRNNECIKYWCDVCGLHAG